MANKKIFIGVKVGSTMNDGDVVAATNLKGVCDQTGISYNTAKTAEWHSLRTYLKGTQGVIWSVHRVDLKAIEGRGNIKI